MPHDRIAEEGIMADDHARDDLAQLRALVATTHPFGATGTAGATEIDPAPAGGDKPRP